jgi:hypothetical protein
MLNQRRKFSAQGPQSSSGPEANKSFWIAPGPASVGSSQTGTQTGSHGIRGATPVLAAPRSILKQSAPYKKQKA